MTISHDGNNGTDNQLVRTVLSLSQVMRSLRSLGCEEEKRGKQWRHQHCAAT